MPKLNKRKTRLRLLFLFPIAACLLIAACVWLMQPPGLTRTAFARYSLQGAEPVGWITNSEVIVQTVDSGSSPGLPRIKHPAILDVRTGSLTPIADLETLWQGDRGKLAFAAMNDSVLSPDGRTMLIRAHFQYEKSMVYGPVPANYRRFYLLDVVTKRVRIVPVNDVQWADWMPDSDRIWMISTKTRVNDHASVKTPVPTTFTFWRTDGRHATERATWQQTDSSEQLTSIRPDNLMWTWSGPVWTQGGIIQPPNEFHWSGYDLATSQTPKRTYVVPYPSWHRPIGGPIPSQGNKRCAWVFGYERPSNATDLQEKLFAGTSLATHFSANLIEEIWISDGEGRNLRNLGYVEMPNEKQVLYFVDWLPDGKSISFELSGSLYVVPVN